MKTFESAQTEPRQPLLDLVQMGPDQSVLVAVSEDGEWLANLIEFGVNGPRTCEDAQPALEAEGFDTSFARWDERGAITFPAREYESFVDIFGRTPFPFFD